MTSNRNLWKIKLPYFYMGALVKTGGLEPPTPCMSSRYSNQLSYAFIWIKNGRGDRTWTCGLCVPNAALYQTEPHLDNEYLILQSLWALLRSLLLRFPKFFSPWSGVKFRPRRLFIFPKSATGSVQTQSYKLNQNQCMALLGNADIIYAFFIKVNI